jgi:hypothetical protein
MKNISRSLRELREFLTDLEARLAKHKSFRAECIEIRLMRRQLEISEQFMNDSEQDISEMADKAANKKNDRVASLTQMVSVAEKVYEIIQWLFNISA